MKAAYIEETGPAQVIIVGDLPMPAVGPDDILVKVQAVAVDPIDTYIRSGAYKIDLKFPFIIGRDMVGSVAEVGAYVSGFRKGDTVWCNNQGYSGRQGTFAEYLSIDQKFLYHLPAGVDKINALASLHSALTAVVGIVEKAQIKSGETIFINGGSGNVGTCATQLAKAMGANVIVTAGSSDKEQYCRECGADAVVNYKKQDVVEAVLKQAPNGIEVYWDLTRQPEVQTGLKLLRRRGRILLSSGLTHQSTFKVGDFYTHNCSMFGFTITDLDDRELAQHAATINREFQRNTFQTRIARTLSLSEAVLSHQLLEQNDLSGKVIVNLE